MEANDLKKFTEKRCYACNGSKQLMGGGMIMKKCHACEGVGKLFVANDDIEYLDSINTKSFLADDEIKNDEVKNIPVIKKRGRPFSKDKIEKSL